MCVVVVRCLLLLSVVVGCCLEFVVVAVPSLVKVRYFVWLFGVVGGVVVCWLLLLVYFLCVRCL